MIQLEKPRGFWDYIRLWRLYMQAFPADERKPWRMIRKKAREGITDMWCLRRDGAFAGLAFTINSADVILLDYFAVCAKLRGCGVGSGALAALLARYAGKGFFVEIESTFVNAPDQAMRLRRKDFYMRSGLQPFGVEMKLFCVDMELLGTGCKLDFDGYRRFHYANYGQWVYKHITPK